MHLFESWFCKPQLNLEVSKINFNSLASIELSYSIHLYSEAEVLNSVEPFAYANNMYGETRHSVLYPMSPDSKKMFLIIPTNSEPQKMDLEYCGKSHISSHFGAILSKAIFAVPVARGSSARFYITLSTQIKNDIADAEEEFLIGVLQRSVSQKIKKPENQIQHTVYFEDDVFSNAALKNANIVSNYMCVTRTLINMPANILNPQTYEEFVKHLIEQSNQQSTSENNTSIDLEVMNYAQLEAIGCGLICAVGKGSTIPPRILKLTYNPKNSTKHVALVGKGITFDSGGYDIKASTYMRNMKKDMGGSASVVGTFFAAANLNLPIRLTCYLAVAENMVSGNAMRPGDIYTAHNGLRVEIDNTDAEGRLVLGDALSIAAAEKPDWIVDFATLTGAARTALGTLVDAAFGNRKEYNELLQIMSQETGDWVWQLPLPQQYNSYFDSRVGDIANSTTTPYGGAITAALFLQKFVGSCAWNHIDTFMWCDRASGLWGEDNAPTAKCVRLMVHTLKQISQNMNK